MNNLSLPEVNHLVTTANTVRRQREAVDSAMEAESNRAQEQLCLGSQYMLNCRYEI